MLRREESGHCIIELLNTVKIWEHLSISPDIWKALDVESWVTEGISPKAIIYKICGKEGLWFSGCLKVEHILEGIIVIIWLVIWTELDRKSAGAHILLKAVRNKQEVFCSAGSKWGGRKKRQQDAEKKKAQVAGCGCGCFKRQQDHLWRLSWGQRYVLHREWLLQTHKWRNFAFGRSCLQEICCCLSPSFSRSFVKWSDIQSLFLIHCYTFRNYIRSRDYSKDNSFF